ncbi:hypothetical protein LG307_14865 [Sutcliffiella horikoshii]
MSKVIDDGVYCYQCESFLNRQELLEAECWCAAEKWVGAKLIIETEENDN